MRGPYPVRRNIVRTDEEDARLSRLARQGDIKARDLLVATHAELAYSRASRYHRGNTARKQIEFDDLLSAALMGLTIAAGKWNPDADNAAKFSTYAFWWVNKYVSEEIEKKHWVTAKPSVALRQDYLYRRMDDDEAGRYIAMFMEHNDVKEDAIVGSDDDEIMSNSIMEASKKAKLNLAEETVFKLMYDPNSPLGNVAMVARELGLTQIVVTRHEESALAKIRKVMGVPE